MQEVVNTEYLPADDAGMKDEGAGDGAAAAAGAGAGAGGGDGKRVAPANRITTRYMTKYEKARILGTRALQLR
jgi:DNA-directed RNA polymerase I, II, and III subunit RPABC2